MAYHSKNPLYRDTENAIIGGVCAGLSDYIKMDVTLIRIVAAATILAWGSGFFLYLILWVILPKRPQY